MLSHETETGDAPGAGGAPPPGAPADQSSRDRIAEDLKTTLFVEAGAGSGKTSALVSRVLALVITGEAELRHIAAITFTEKAAAELRDRIRRELERHAGEGETPGGQRCRAALEQLDGAAIGTLHAFARRLLSEHAIDAGLPPSVEVLDEVSSSVAFSGRWSEFQDRLLAEPQQQRTLLLLFGAGVKADALRYLAQGFEENWDLVEEQVPETSPEPPPLRPLVRQVLDRAVALLGEPCRDPGDLLLERIGEIVEGLRRLVALEDEIDLMEAITDRKSFLPSFRVGGTGRIGAWDDVAEVRSQVVALGHALDEARSHVVTACAERVGAALREWTLAAAWERRASGELGFHDLLVLARALLRDPERGPAVRVRLHQRYRRLLLDELQDTDPIQIELAVRIAAEDPASEEAGTLGWDEVPVEPGALFMVGDPKQSIYRFRRADIRAFRDASRRFGAGGGLVELSANFRTVPAVIEWVNHTFGSLMGTEEDDAGAQAGFSPLRAVREPVPVGPPVAVVGRRADQGLKADQLRVAEAEDVAAAITTVMAEQWAVGDEGGASRAARLGDITVLVPARTSMPFLEDALTSAGIAFRAESSSLVYASRAVRDVLMVLRAVGDPTDDLSIVSALRTPLLGCGDDDLFRFAGLRRGRWSYLSDQPETVPSDDPVRRGLHYLKALYDERHWLAPSELLDRIARDRRAFELGASEGRPRDVWRRLRFVIDQARAWSDATGGTLREYLAWMELQALEGTRAAEAVLPETDDDAVRIMTIHAAKGLEFPITVLSGMSTVPRSFPAPAQAVFHAHGQVGYRFGGQITTPEYEAWRPIDELMGYEERIRLLYVACTRTRDHLVLSLHRPSRVKPPQPRSRTNAELLVDGMGPLLDQLPDMGMVHDGTAAASPPPLLPVPPGAPPPFPDWASERDQALLRAGRPRTVAATALTDEGDPDAGAAAGGVPAADRDLTDDPGLQKRPRDLDLPPWLKGRYGSAVGRAVHGVLQTIDLATGEDLDALVASQCVAEAVADRAGDVRRLVVDALGSSCVRQAASLRHWRELYVATPVGDQMDRLLEGYVDLVYRTAEGFVVVDYKTAGTSDPDELDARVAGYRNQGASYALAVAAATGESVLEVIFLFLTPDGSIERRLPDLEGSVAHVRSLLLAGDEALVP